MKGSDRRPLVFAAALACLALALPGPRPAAASPAGLELVGHDSIGGRGMNSALALAGHCAYVGSRGLDPVAVLDVADPAAPRVAGSMPARAGATSRELRAVPDLHLLIVMSYALTAGGANQFDLYRVGSGCSDAVPLGGYSFGSASPHEFFLWRDPERPARILLFTTMFGSAGPDLLVVDVSDPAQPRLAGAWRAPAGPLHSIDVDGAGRAYLSLWTSGLLVADVSDFTAGRPDPQVRVLTKVGASTAPAGGNVHSAVPVPGLRVVVATDERYPPACPYGPARTVDVSDPARPVQLAVLAAPENDAAACRQAPRGTYTSHNPTLTRSLAFISWYSSGLQVFDLSEPAAPVRLTEYRPVFALPAAVDPQLGSTTTSLTWSYPILRDGLVWLADINQGLVVLRYHGPHEAEVADTGFAEGNSNLVAALPRESPSPPRVPATPAATPAPSRPRSSPRQGGPPPGWPLAAALIAMAAAVVALGWRRRRP